MENNCAPEKVSIKNLLLTLCSIAAIIISLINIGFNVSQIVDLRTAFESRSGVINIEVPVWISEAKCSDCGQVITKSNLFRHLNKGHDIMLMTTDNEPVSSDVNAFRKKIGTNDITAVNCWDCDERVTEENYQDHLAEGHHIMVKLSRSHYTTVGGPVKYEAVDGDFVKGISDTGSVPLFVRVRVTDNKAASYNEESWLREGNYFYYKQQLLPGESTGAFSQDPSIEVEETAVADASLYAPDQIMKPFANIE